MRDSPNVIITGTPGVGKTVHCEQLAQDTGLRHLSINKIAKERNCFETYDQELETWVVDEDKVWFSCYKCRHNFPTNLSFSFWMQLKMKCFRVDT